MKQAIIYIRVSTQDQAREGVSLDNQLAKARGWAALNGFEVSESNIFRDEGLSAKRADNRPGLQAALAACGKGDALVVYSLSRLARSTKDAILISERLRKRDANLVSQTENIDTTSAAGTMIFGVLSVLAQFERDLLSERTTGAMQYKKQQREHYCRAVYGYDEVNGKLEPNATEQAVIARMTRMRGQGASLRSIADQLTADGIAAKRGGSEWRASSVSSILAGQGQLQAA
jgi:site-specific DNA recombinase